MYATEHGAVSVAFCHHRHHNDGIAIIVWGVAIMPAVTIRNLPEATHRALKLRAAQHNRSAEAEIRAILEDAVHPAGRRRLGTALADMSRRIGLTNADLEALEPATPRTPAEPLHLA